MQSKISRRRLLASLSAFTLTLRANAQLFRSRAKKHPAEHPFVYIGCDTEKGVAKGVYVSRFDPATGHLTDPVLACATFRPAYFAFGPVHGTQRMLYIGNEGSNAATATVTTFAVDPVSGMLSEKGKVSSGTPGTAYISVDSTGKAAFVANYSGSAVASYHVLPDGTLSSPVEVLDYKDKRFGAPGPNTARQDASHPHCATISPDNRFVVVCDLGTDRISIFAIHPETGKLGQPTFFHVAEGSGPRHVAFHSNGRWLYGIDELSNRIDQYLWSATHGANATALLTDTAHSVQTVSPDYHGEVTNTAAEVLVSPNGYQLYASNRGENTLVVFAIDQENGTLSLLQRISCGGKGPRQFTLDETGNWLVCGNQLSASVTVFARDAATGKLNGPLQTLAIDSPMFTLFA